MKKRYHKFKSRPVEDWLKHDGIKERNEVKFIKKQLINSKGNVCAICGKPITNMKDCTLDHIKPVSKGGLTTIENCQLAHFLCNQRKGNSELNNPDDSRCIFDSKAI